MKVENYTQNLNDYSQFRNQGRGGSGIKRAPGTIAKRSLENTPGNTWRDAMECWGGQYLRACGFKVPQHRMEIAA